MDNNKVVLIVHTVDTEGPLYESLDAKFVRLNDLFSITDIAHTKQNYKKLQNGEIPLGGIEKDIKKVLSKHLVSYNDTWDKIDAMMQKLMSNSFRSNVLDSRGNGWRFTWHCLDHVGYDYNPRRRDLGFHNIFDYYKDWVDDNSVYGDEIQWHFHPMSTYKEAHRCATSYFRNDLVYQILCRKIIERDWFPSVYRAGFTTERPDSHWFLEQWIPFDISNMAIEDYSELDKTIDFKDGRSSNWRNAPSDWSIYHPDHDDYQKSGDCRRWIGRALNIMNRIASIDQHEVNKAFKKADSDNQPVLMAVASHDYRNLETEVNHVQSMLLEAAKKYPNVRFEYCTAREGFRRAIWPNNVILDSKLKLSINFFDRSERDVPYVVIKVESGKVFGPQPFLAIETKSRNFIHDNLDFTADNEWRYAFHENTLPIEDVKRLAVAANDKYGNTVVLHLEPKQ